MSPTLPQRPAHAGLPPGAWVEVHDAAARWFTRRSEPGWTRADEQALGDWLAASALHREVFDGLSQLDRDLHRTALGREAAARPTARTPQRPAAPAPARSRRRAWLPAALACGVLLLLGGAYGWQRWSSTPGWALEVATARGETRTLDLPDGSQVTLNRDSRLRFRFFPHRREAVLDHGEAFFRVAADAGRPFTVDSGAAQVKVVGTAFNVRAVPPQLVVQVLEGRVELRPDRAGAAPRVLVLGAGAGVAVDPATGLARRVPTDAATVGDWRQGRLHFQRTPLGEVAQELSRYLGVPVTLASADLAAQPISAVVATDSPQAFLRALPELLPLRVTQSLDGGWRIAQR